MTAASTTGPGQSLKSFIASNSNCFVLILLSICLKLLLIPAYHSTDFEVHRNWLAITHSLPVREWYFESTSEWTLDYPPFFAYFEFLLSQPAQFIDKQMLQVTNLNYKSNATINYQRLTVILTEATLIFALLKYLKYLDDKNEFPATTPSRQSNFFGRNCFLTVQIVLNFALIMIDNIHFQYNGFLFGILMLSIFYIQTNHWLLGSFLFSCLINLKHIYLYIAPAFFLHILSFYCLQLPAHSAKLNRLIQVAASAILPFILSLGPFIYMNQIPQLALRLFPFKRGLCHAYWAPNFWALYNFADKLLTTAFKKQPQNSTSGGSTSGLVQDISHVVLPSVAPVTTFILSLVFMLGPMLFFIYQHSRTRRNNNSLVVLTIICGFASFLFGWHVHEKAVLMILIPLSYLSFTDRKFAQLYFLMSLVSNYSLFPLIFRSQEYPIKLIGIILSAYYNYLSFRTQFNEFRLDIASVSAIFGLVLLEVYNSAVHFILSLDVRLPYLPLMLTSVFCAVYVIFCWIRFLHLVLKQNSPSYQKDD